MCCWWGACMSRRLRLLCLAISWKGVGGSRRLPRLESSHLESLSPVSLLYTSSELATPMCNPIADYGKVLFRLHTMEVLPEAAVFCIERLQEAGLEQYESYVNERLVTRTKSVFKPIETNRLDLMAPTTTRQIKTPQEKALQDTCSTLAQLYVASEVRGGSSDEFFSHEIPRRHLGFMQMRSFRANFFLPTRLKNVNKY